MRIRPVSYGNGARHPPAHACESSLCSMDSQYNGGVLELLCIAVQTNQYGYIGEFIYGGVGGWTEPQSPPQEI
jgi:hypothetical protein